MKKYTKSLVLLGFLILPTAGKAIDFFGLVAVWLVTRCAVQIYCNPVLCCSCSCHCKYTCKEKLTVEELQAYIRHLRDKNGIISSSKRCFHVTPCVLFKKSDGQEEQSEK